MSDRTRTGDHLDHNQPELGSLSSIWLSRAVSGRWGSATFAQIGTTNGTTGERVLDHRAIESGSFPRRLDSSTDGQLLLRRTATACSC